MMTSRNYFKQLVLITIYILCFIIAFVWRPFAQEQHHQIFHTKQFKATHQPQYFLLLKNSSQHLISNDEDIVGPFKTLYAAHMSANGLKNQSYGAPHYLPIERKDHGN